MTQTISDFTLIGGGIMGLTLALEAKRRYPDQRILLLEKEPQCGLHASGRNSGVLHAGFYYTADSLKARFTREGNRMMREYCQQRGVRLNGCGKLVVTRSPDDLPALALLQQRGKANGVELLELSPTEAKEIEPRVKTCEKALFSPTTASVDPKEVMASLVKEALANGITILTDTRFLGRAGEQIRTNHGQITPGYLINAAGLYADRIAHLYNFGLEYAILPFRGLYLYTNEPPEALRTHVYPVPNLANPFLGVHYTLTVDGRIKIGPTAIPAFWREHYRGLRNFRLRECGEILWRAAGLFFRNDFAFRRLAFDELRKQSKAQMGRLAEELLESGKDLPNRQWGEPGIRAQLLHRPSRQLEMDFRFTGDHRSFHLLNAVSPGFTCALPFARFLFDRIEEKIA